MRTTNLFGLSTVGLGDVALLCFVASVAVGCGQPPAGLDGATTDSAASSDQISPSVDAADADQVSAPMLTPEQMAMLATLSPTQLPAPPADVSNRFADDPRAAHLGQALFFDPSFSGRLLDPDNDGTAQALGHSGDTGRVACAGCHLPMAGFLDTRSLGGSISLGAGWGVRKAPSLLDVGQDRLLTWDGRHDAMFNQVFGPIESPLEMNSSRLYVAQQLARNYRSEYEALFGNMPAFDDAQYFPQVSAQATGCTPSPGPLQPTCTGTIHGLPGDHAEFDGLASDDQHAVTLAVVNFGKAVGAFERRLTCGPSRFDAWMHGQVGALTDSEQRGAGIFVGEGRCINCHSGPYMSDQRFHSVGLSPRQVNFSPPDYNDQGAFTGIATAIADPLNVRGVFSDGDDGRLPTAVVSSMEESFKTPMLRCVSLRLSYMHTGQLHSLTSVVSFFDRGGDGPGTFATNELQPIGLSTASQQDLVAFLQSLTGPGPSADLQNSGR